MNIADVVARRSDLSTFLVHLTRDGNEGDSAESRLRTILSSGVLEARSVFGSFKQHEAKLTEPAVASQKCVCFTETPLEFTQLLLEQISYRDVVFRPYGIAIPKKLARKKGVNPIWYLDMTPGHDWLTKPIEVLVEAAMNTEAVEQQPIAKLAPFFDWMGTWPRADDIPSRKEFWWEREWRHRGDFSLPNRVIAIAPESDHPSLRTLRPNTTFVDASWSLEQMIARLAGFSAEETDIL